MHKLMRLICWVAIACVLGRGEAGAEDVLEASRRVVEGVIATELQQPGRVGFSVALACGDQMVIEKGYGKADLEHDVAATEESLFRVGSVTKQFTAALIMHFVERDEIALDDAIDEHTDFSTGDQTVTVRQLLQHTSGIRSYTAAGDDFNRFVSLERTPEEVLGLVRGKPLDFSPGTRFDYSNTNYFLLGRIVESVGQRSYAELLRERLLGPMGLRCTRYDSNSEIIRGRAQGYALQGGALKNDGLMGVSQPFAAGALLSTAGDLVRWEWALSSGQHIAKESYELMNNPAVLPDKADPYFRYGFGRIVDTWEGQRVYFHGGGINGFSACLAHLPDSAITVAVLANSEAIDTTVIVKSMLQRLPSHAMELR